MAREARVTLTLREEDARWLLEELWLRHNRRLWEELKHALAECDCGEEGR